MTIDGYLKTLNHESYNKYNIYPRANPDIIFGLYE